MLMPSNKKKNLKYKTQPLRNWVLNENGFLVPPGYCYVAVQVLNNDTFCYNLDLTTLKVNSEGQYIRNTFTYPISPTDPSNTPLSYLQYFYFPCGTGIAEIASQHSRITGLNGIRISSLDSPAKILQVTLPTLTVAGQYGIVLTINSDQTVTAGIPQSYQSMTNPSEAPPISPTCPSIY